MGVMDGVHYCMDVLRLRCLDRHLFWRQGGLRLPGSPEGRTELDALDFPKRFYYRQRPWFMPPALALLKLKDRLGF